MVDYEIYDVQESSIQSTLELTHDQRMLTLVVLLLH